MSSIQHEEYCNCKGDFSKCCDNRENYAAMAEEDDYDKIYVPEHFLKKRQYAQMYKKGVAKESVAKEGAKGEPRFPPRGTPLPHSKGTVCHHYTHGFYSLQQMY